MNGGNATAGRRGFESARLTARPWFEGSDSSVGEMTLEFHPRGEALLYVPSNYSIDVPPPFALMLHGAGGNAHHGMGLLRDYADEYGLLLLCPGSQGSTWDVISKGGYGPDVALIDAALEEVFSNYPVDPKRLAIGGFSDGASYALSVGLSNGDLFTHVMAFSPGFAVPTSQPDSPKVYISHGDDDKILPVDACSRRLVPILERAGYSIHYREFHGGHVLPMDVAREALAWFTKR